MGFPGKKITACPEYFKSSAIFNLCHGFHCSQRTILLDDDEFRVNNASIHEGHLCQNGILTWFVF